VTEWLTPVLDLPGMVCGLTTLVWGGGLNTVVISNLPYVYTCFLSNNCPQSSGRTGLCPEPNWGSLQRSADLLASGEKACCPSPRISPLAVDPSGPRVRPHGFFLSNRTLLGTGSGGRDLELAAVDERVRARVELVVDGKQ